MRIRVNFIALLVFSGFYFCFAAGAAHAAQYVIHPSGANASNCAAFWGVGPSTDLDANDSDSSYAGIASSGCDLYMDLDRQLLDSRQLHIVHLANHDHQARRRGLDVD